MEAKDDSASETSHAACAKESKNFPGWNNDDKSQPASPNAAEKRGLEPSVQPEGKRDASYWEGPEGVLKRATTFVYRRLISPQEEGGMQGFFKDNCSLFKGRSKSDEQSLEFMPL
jgi:hypothetical protein